MFFGPFFQERTACFLSANIPADKTIVQRCAGGRNTQEDQLRRHPDARSGPVADLLDREDGLHHRHRPSHRGETLDRTHHPRCPNRSAAVDAGRPRGPCRNFLQRLLGMRRRAVHPTRSFSPGAWSFSGRRKRHRSRTSTSRTRTATRSSCRAVSVVTAEPAARRTDSCDGRRRESKAFFFEKKKQKAFVSAVADSPAALVHGDRFLEKNCLSRVHRSMSWATGREPITGATEIREAVGTTASGRARARQRSLLVGGGMLPGVGRRF